MTDWKRAAKWGLRRPSLKQEAERLREIVGNSDTYKIQRCTISKADHYRGWYVLSDDGTIIRSDDWVEIFKFVYRRGKKYAPESATWEEQKLFLSIENN